MNWAEIFTATLAGSAPPPWAMAPGWTTPCGGNMGNVGGAKAATVGGIAGGI